MQYKKVEKFILKLLKDHLPGHLSYHSVIHVKDVINASMEIAENEGVRGKNKVLIKTAALFHDSGFLYGSKEHEKKSCEIAAKYLPDYGYSEEDIKKISGMIMATKIPQNPQNHLEQILADADLDYLGRDDFFTIGNQLFEELAVFDIVHDEFGWNSIQERFLESHHYWTRTALEKRKAKKDEHLKIIKAKLGK